MAFMAAALPFLQYAGMAMSAVSALKGSQASKDAYAAQARTAEENAKLAELQAEDSLRRGEVAAGRQGIKTNQTRGTQRAMLAANGVDLGVGSALGIITDTDYFGGVDQATIRDNAAREAWGYRTQGLSYQGNADLLSARSNAEKPWMAAGTSLLTSAGKVAGGWYKSNPMTSASSLDLSGAGGGGGNYNWGGGF